MKSPCKECQNRHVGCHSKCEEYLTFADERKRIQEVINKEKSFVDIHAERQKRRKNVWRKSKANNAK